MTCVLVNGLRGRRHGGLGHHQAAAWSPTSLLGRVSSLDWFISIAGLPVSYALTAPVAGLLGARQTLVGAGVLGAAVTLAALFLPGMREVDGALEPRRPHGLAAA